MSCCAHPTPQLNIAAPVVTSYGGMYQYPQHSFGYMTHPSYQPGAVIFSPLYICPCSFSRLSPPKSLAPPPEPSEHPKRRSTSSRSWSGISPVVAPITSMYLIVGCSSATRPIEH